MLREAARVLVTVTLVACNAITGADRLQKVEDACDGGCADSGAPVTPPPSGDAAATLDASGEAREAGEAGEAGMCAPSGAALPKLDLVGDPTFSPPPQAGQTFAVSIVFRNDGNADGPRNGVGFGVFEGPSRLGGADPQGGAIAPGATGHLTGGGIRPLASGTHSLRIVVDDLALVCEADRSGGERVVTLTIP